jgi:hypothetical protein
MGRILVLRHTAPTTHVLVTPLEQGFTAFWAAYPRRKGKKDAWKAWQQLCPSACVQAQIVTALVWQIKEWTHPRYTPLPASYLRGERWTDEPNAPAAPVEARRPVWARSTGRLPHYAEWSCQHGGAVYKDVVQDSCTSRSQCSIRTTLNRPVVPQTEGEQ